jgi:L-aspartate oxidase
MGTFDAPPLAPEVVLRIRTILWEQVGVIRSAAGLESALAELDALEEKLRRLSTPPVRPLLLVARLITRTALLRTESRGCHFRTDFPEPDPGAPRHSQVEVGTDGLAIRAFLAEAPTEPTPPAEVSSPA